MVKDKIIFLPPPTHPFYARTGSLTGEPLVVIDQQRRWERPPLSLLETAVEVVHEAVHQNDPIKGKKPMRLTNRAALQAQHVPPSLQPRSPHQFWKDRKVRDR